MVGAVNNRKVQGGTASVCQDRQPLPSLRAAVDRLEDGIGRVPVDIVCVLHSVARKWKGLEDAFAFVRILQSAKNEIVTDGLLELLIGRANEAFGFVIKARPLVKVRLFVVQQARKLNATMETWSRAGPVSLQREI